MSTNRQIIIIDDDQEIIDSVSFILGRNNISVKGFHDGNLAIKHIQDTGYQGVVICDAQMPKISGWNCVAKMVELGLHQNLVINMLTGVTEPPESSDKCAPFIHDYLVKPFENKELLEVVEHSFEVLKREAG